MSSNIVQAEPVVRPAAGLAGSRMFGADDSERHPFLVSLGERIHALRIRRGLSRKATAAAAVISERHLANLEHGTGNASILVLLHVSEALGCSLAELVGDVTTSSPEWLLMRGLLAHRDEATLRKVREAVAEILGTGAGKPARSSRVALIGLRGAGKSTLGRMLADDLDFPFVELSREIERLAGCSVGEIQDLCGMNGYRRYERRALEEAIGTFAQAVIAAPGGVVSDVGTFNLLLGNCTTVWLQATPEDHMRRVTEQNDLRPMAGSSEAMEDLKRILAERAAFYSLTEMKLDTSAATLDLTFQALRAMTRRALRCDDASKEEISH